MEIVVRWMTKAIQNLPTVHPLEHVIFDLRGAPNCRPEVIQGLDETLSAAGRPVTSVFNLDPTLCEEDIATRRRVISSAFPLSEKLGLLSFRWSDQR